jgi:hypothetical protein
MPLEKAPEPFNADYYVSDNDATRGAMMHATRVLEVPTVTSHAAKIPQQFVSSSLAPPLPSDPMYVFPRTRFFVLDPPSHVSVANQIVATLHAISPQSSQIRTDARKLKVSVEVPGILDFKVKLFTVDNGSLMVVVRRDSGDWFMFIQLFSALKKHLRESMTIETI